MTKRTQPAARSAKSWQGRLSADADVATTQLVASLDVDMELWPHDIAGSMAHAQMLREACLLSAGEFDRIRRGLKSIGRDLEAGTLQAPLELEDIHMVIEKALIERAGDAGAKLHTGRSRNDQVATDLRLWAMDAFARLAGLVRSLQRGLVELAAAQGRIVMPAYTHLQRAQPVLSGHAVLAYVEMLHRDVERLVEARRRTSVCPLGSGAVAGTSLPLDRKRTAALLGFASVSRNSIDATSDRDFLAELCFCCAMIGVHMSRWAEDWIIYSSSEFAAIELSDRYCTSSSMMPQKKNPDTLELIRAKSAAAIGNLTGMLTLLKGLPTAYNRDLQDDKRFAFASVSALSQALTVAAGIASTTRFHEGRIASGLDAGYLDATALAEYLVRRGVPFRKAHHAVGTLVAKAARAGTPLRKLPLDELRTCGPVQADVYEYLGCANVVRRYSPPGAGGARQLKQQLGFWRRELRRNLKD